MKRFKFRLEPILKHRDIKEKEQQVVISKSMAELKRLQDYLNKIDMSEISARKKYASMGDEIGGINPGTFWMIDNFIQGQKLRRKRINEDIQAQEEIVRKDYEKFLEIRKEKEMVQILKKKKTSAYKKAAIKYENKKQDDLYIMRSHLAKKQKA